MAAEDMATEKISNGETAAAFLSAGIGVAFLGLFTTLAEASEGIKEALVISEPVGPLSGKTTFAVILWLAAWGALYAMWRKKEVNFKTIMTASLALVGLGLLLTFPPFFVLFAPPE